MYLNEGQQSFAIKNTAMEEYGSEARAYSVLPFMTECVWINRAGKTEVYPQGPQQLIPTNEVRKTLCA